MEELLDCMICFERFVEPKILNCGHTYCCKCLDKYHKTNLLTRRDLDTTRICCPTCREPTPWPENGAKELRMDFKVTKIQEFLASLDIKSSSDSPSLPKLKQLENCFYCLSLKKKVPSHVYCIVCEKSYCKNCQSKHKENPLFAKHSSINIGRSLGGQKVSDLLSNECEVHQKEMLKYVCVTCSMPLCTLCVMNHHQKCEVQPIDQYLKSKTSTIKNLLAEVGSKKEDLKRQLDVLEPARVASEQACMESEKLIKKRSEILINEVKKKEEDLLVQLRKVRDKQLLPVQKEMERLKFHMSRVKAIEQMANDKTMSFSKCVVTYPILIQRMKTLLEVDFICDQTCNFSRTALKFTPGSNQLGFGSVDKDERSPDIQGPNRKFSKPDISLNAKAFENPLRRASKFDVSPDARVVASPERRLETGSEMKNVLGNNYRKTSKSDSTPEPKGVLNPFRRASKFDVSPDLNPMRKRVSVGFSQTMLVQKIFLNGSQPGELSQAIWLAEMGKNTFAVSDCGNKRIQVFQTSGKVLSVIDGDLNPMGIAVTNKRNIIIADCVHQMMQVFSPEGKLLSKWGAGKFKTPCDVAICPNGDMIISDIGENSVSLYKNESKKILTLGLSGSEEMSFKEPRYVAAGPNNEIIVSDCKDHFVKVFDSKGQLLAKMGGEGINEGDLSSPNGVCYMSQGRLVVADTGNNRLTTFSLSGAFLGHMPVEVTSPRGVSQVGNKYLVVSEFDSYSNHCSIKIFDNP